MRLHNSTTRFKARRRKRIALTLLELLAVVALLGIVAIAILPRFTRSSDTAKTNACHTNREEIEIQSQLWRRDKGSFPAANLSDLKADTNYYPEGLPICPVDGTTYTIDTATGKVIGHDH